jgi:hypothetical protein
MSPTGKSPSELDLASEGVMQLDFDVQFTFLNMLHSTTAGHPHSALELHQAETTTPASQLEVIME